MHQNYFTVQNLKFSSDNGPTPFLWSNEALLLTLLPHCCLNACSFDA